MERYAMLEKVGEGTFGQVFRAKLRETGEVVALKKVRLKRAEDGLAVATLREMKALERLRHANVVRLHEAFPHGSNVVLVLEYVASDLARLMEHADAPLPECHVKGLMLMTLRALGVCHAHGILHRDLKPSNLLLTARGVLKLADFGLSRLHAHGKAAAPPDEPYSHQVATRWYRAPELLFGARRYGTGVDLWAAGAIWAQLVLGAPLFPGENDIDQIFRVAAVLGTPSEAVWPGVSELPDFGKVSFPHLPPVPLGRALPRAPAAAVQLLDRLLAYAPARRLSADEAAADPYWYVAPPPSRPRQLPVPGRAGGSAPVSAWLRAPTAPLDDPLEPLPWGAAAAAAASGGGAGPESASAVCGDPGSDSSLSSLADAGAVSDTSSEAPGRRR